MLLLFLKENNAFFFKVAIKVIDKKKAKEDPYVSKNMRREGKLLQMIIHPNIVQLFELMETENRFSFL